MNHLHYQTHAKPILSSTHTAFFFFFFFPCHELPVLTSGNFFLNSKVVMLHEGQHFPAKIANVHFKTLHLSKREAYTIATLMICDIFRKWHSSPIH